MRSVLNRLKRRKLGQWSIGYLAAAFVAVQVMDGVSGPLEMSLAAQQRVLFLLVVGFFLTLVLAWYHGEQGRQQVAGAEIGLIAGLLAFAGIGLVVIGPANLEDGATSSAAETPVGKGTDLTMGVLPLADLSSDPEEQYFAQGLTSEIHSKLARLEGLQLVPRTSTLRFADDGRDLREIGSELGVRFLLTGGVYRAGDEVRIDVQVSDVSTGFDVWSDQFRGTFDDVFDFQSATALAIADSLGLTLTAAQVEAIRARYTDSAEAYDAYLHGWAMLESFHVRLDVPEQRLETARDYFERAITLEPEFAPAVAGLSMVEGYYVFHGVDRSDERLERSLELARRALEMEPLLPEAHAALGDALYLQSATDQAIESYQEAVRLDEENAVAWCHLANAGNAVDDHQTAEAAARRAIRLYPTYYWSHTVLGDALVAQGRGDEAIEAYQNAMRLNPDARGPYFDIAEIHLEREDWEAALAVYERARERFVTTGLLLSIGVVSAAAGEIDRAAEALEEAFERGGSVERVERSSFADVVLGSDRLSALLDRYR